MKRLLALLAALWLLPLCARAELPLVYPAETVMSVIPLTPVQKQLVEHLYAPVLEGRTRIELPQGTRYDDVGPAMTALMMDYPELFHLHRSYTISYYQNEPEVAVAVNPEYRMDAAEAAQARQELYHAALTLIRADGTAVGLHDALVERVTYGGTTEMRHTAAAALLDGLATCEGYAQALSLLYRMAGIPCGVIAGEAVQSATGQREKHAWNIMYMGGCSLIDATWNDQEHAGFNTHWYFGLSTDQMAADHTPDANLIVPVCGDQAGWHRLLERYADDLGDVARAVEALVRYGEPVNLRITDADMYAALSGDLGGFLDSYNAQCAEGAAFYGSYTYLTCDAQQCIIMK